MSPSPLTPPRFLRRLLLILFFSIPLAAVAVQSMVENSQRCLGAFGPAFSPAFDRVRCEHTWRLPGVEVTLTIPWF